MYVLFEQDSERIKPFMHTCLDEQFWIMQEQRQYLRGGVAQWVARLTRNVEVVGSSPIKGPRCYLEQDTLPLLLSTGWFQKGIRA